jgi:3-hydroxyisobutyrate dehydrogenase
MDGQAVGFVSNDAQAAQIVLRLAEAGRRVSHHIFGGAEKPARAPGIEAAATPADIADECSIILILVDDTSELRKMLMGTVDRRGLAADMRPASVLVDLGVRPPRETQSLLGLLGMRGVGVVDAALLGSPGALTKGTLTILAGGYPEALDQAEPVLRLLGTVERTGPLGSAQTAAALTGYVEAAHMAARADALAVGQALGLSAATLSNVLKDEPEMGNVVRLNRRADALRKIAEEKGLGAQIIDLAERRRTPGTSESR